MWERYSYGCTPNHELGAPPLDQDTKNGLRGHMLCLANQWIRRLSPLKHPTRADVNNLTRGWKVVNT